MHLPTLSELPTTREMVEVFRGYNHNLRIGDGEFYDMTNMTSAHYPVLSPRCKRGLYTISGTNPSGEVVYTSQTAQALIAKDSLCWVDGTNFYKNGHKETNVSQYLEETDEKQLISMGAYVLIFPDKVYFNTESGEAGRIEAEFVKEEGEPITFSLCSIDGEVYENIATVEPALDDRESGQYWLDKTSTPHSLKCWSASSGMWVTVGTTYIKISATGIGSAFNQYDGVTISGLSDGLMDGAKDENGEYIISHDENIESLNGSFVIWAKDDDSIAVVGMLDEECTLINKVTIKRQMPVMDFIVESENRLWGCHYGEDVNGNVVNEIYASKLGDFKNWNCFMGVSTDSYVASVGTDGLFTGAITHFGYPLFFKETCMHKVYGNYPSNYQIQTTACRGVQKGCGRSLAIVNETLYYKSRNGVCAYDGSLPVEISAQLGDIAYSEAVAGSHGNKYYISMKNPDGKYLLFVYDAQRGLWHKEDELQVDAFCSCDNEMYCIEGTNRNILTLLGSGTPQDGNVEWMVETGEIGTSMPDQKYVSRLVIRMTLVDGAEASFSISYDSADEWVPLFKMEGHSLRSFEVPIRPRRCDHFRVRIEGKGDAKIYSIAKTIEQGSDRTR